MDLERRQEEERKQLEAVRGAREAAQKEASAQPPATEPAKAHGAAAEASSAAPNAAKAGSAAKKGPGGPSGSQGDVVSVGLSYQGRRKMLRHGGNTKVGDLLELHPSLKRSDKQLVVTDA